VRQGIDPDQSVTIHGQHFWLGSKITVGSLFGSGPGFESFSGPAVQGSTATQIKPFVYVGDEELQFFWSTDNTNSLPPGDYDVTVENPNGSADSKLKSFHVLGGN
jgi:hypothetical protein